MPHNTAAWLLEAKANPMHLKDLAYPTAGDEEVVVKVHAIALNPMDWMIQAMGNDLFNFIKYPYVGGTDIAGEVVQAGKGVPSSVAKPGDRVLGLCLGITNMDSRQAAFQQYAVLNSRVLSRIPSDLSSEEAAVLPMGVATATAGLYQKDYLALDYPSINPKSNGKTVLIWAGSSSVGSNAIQLAVASGYEVITTCSPKNFDYCKGLGASLVFDYSSSSLTKDLVDAFKDRSCAGAFAILPGSLEPCIEVVRHSTASKFVATALPCDLELPEGVETKFVFATTVKDSEASKEVFEKFLPAALEKKKYQCAPKPKVVGHGLESIQGGLEELKKGVSTTKLVVAL
ncbi:GroES-like protein [Xylariaceae sp. FL1651]|nr:GroES-like protein [Xylariaceae sp. FL1651]